MGLPAEEAHPPKRRSIPVANSQVLDDASNQWEILKGNIEGYQEFVEAHHEAKMKEHINVERQRGLRELEKFSSLGTSDKQTFSKHFPELMTTVGRELAGINEILKHDMEYELVEDVPVHHHPVGTLTDPETEQLVASTVERVKVQVAMDSGSVDNVVHPDDLPVDVVPPGNEDGTHFSGANGSTIKKYGRVVTLLQNDQYKYGCGWEVADVTRPLHSVSVTTGPEDGPGIQDVLFNNRKCYVVPPGIVEEIMRRVKPVAEYGRRGGLYVASLEMSSFPRQGQSQ